ncbi:MAG: hypothetical protein ACR2P3_09205 [Geminicoccaceae bacterium]
MSIWFSALIAFALKYARPRLDEGNADNQPDTSSDVESDTSPFLKPNDVVQLRPGNDRGFGQSPVVVTHQFFGTVYAMRYDPSGSQPIVIPRDACEFIGRLTFAVIGDDHV